MAYYNISVQQGSIAAASVTGTSAGTANTIVTLNRDRRILMVTNDLDTAVMLTYGGADFIELQPSNCISIDGGTNQLQFADTKVIGVYRVGTPTTGRLAVTVL